MSSGTPPAPRQLLARPERRAAILQAAAGAFLRHGFAGTSMDEVAAAAGISRLIVYRHFPSKEALYEAVLLRASDRLRDEFVAGLERGETRGVGSRALMAAARQDPDGFTLVWRHAAREPQFAAHATEYRERAVGLALATLERRGMTDPVQQRWAAEAVVSWLVDAVIHWLEHGSADRDDELVTWASAAVPAMIEVWLGPPTA